MNNYEKLCDILKTNSLLTTKEGELLKNRIQELARKMDPSLLKTLLSNTFTVKMFFTDVDGVKIFDANKFTYMIESQAFLPDSYTRFKQNIMLTDGNRSITNTGDIVLEFPNKDCILEFDSTSTDEKRQEVFLNEILAKNEIDTLLEHKVFKNPVKHTNKEDIPATNISLKDNLIIKGNNLLALHTLFPKYKERIKLMYWDILYNTDNDEVPYNDSFKHSSWLTMMKNRLEIAKKLLANDGVITLQCDDNEQAYLKVLCDEIFGRENFVNCICVKMSDASGPKMAHISKKFPKLKEYILIYKKKNIVINKVTEEKAYWDPEYKVYFDLSDDIMEKVRNNTLTENEALQVNKLLRTSVISLEDAIKKYKIKKVDRLQFCKKNALRIARSSNSSSIKNILDAMNKCQSCILIKFNGNWTFVKTDYDVNAKDPRVQYVFAKDTMNVPLCDIWLQINTSFNSEGGVVLKKGQKPEKLMYYIIKSLSNPGDIILDAYLGSGTTAAVAHKMGRKYIGIEQLDLHYDMAISRLKNVISGDQTGISKTINWTGGGEFISLELAKNSQNILDDIIATDNSNTLIDIYNKLITSPFVLYTVDIKSMEKEKISFNSLSIAEQKKLLISVIDKNTLYINYSDIDNDDINKSLTENDKEFTKKFYKEG